ncbi:MAG: hypothetical protein HY075_16550, partial [Deltaproteobacteria bacterium]|nr:hypothetical protein [Deltaproteobacteria bacterium]
MRQRTATYILLLLAVLAIYGRSIGFAFISGDDEAHFTRNPLLSPPDVPNLIHIWTGPYARLYTPVAYSALWFVKNLSQLLSPLASPAA